MKKTLAAALLGMLMTSAALAGTSVQDPLVSLIRDQFASARPAKIEELKIVDLSNPNPEKVYVCTYLASSKDAFDVEKADRRVAIAKKEDGSLILYAREVGSGEAELKLLSTSDILLFSADISGTTAYAAPRVASNGTLILEAAVSGPEVDALIGNTPDMLEKSLAVEGNTYSAAYYLCQY